jgi:hypothetical protein
VIRLLHAATNESGPVPSLNGPGCEEAPAAICPTEMATRLMSDPWAFSENIEGVSTHASLVMSHDFEFPVQYRSIEDHGIVIDARGISIDRC